jgi:integrase
MAIAPQIPHASAEASFSTGSTGARGGRPGQASNSAVIESASVAASRRRGPSLARRTYQAGSVFQRGRSRSDRWDAEAPAYGRYWKDVPGARPRRIVISLGICRTGSIAERKCPEHIEKLGINSTRFFTESTSTITFKQQAELWLKSLANRKRNPIEQTTIDNRRYALDKWIYPSLADKYLADVNNHAVKELVERMALSLSPASVRDYTNVVKAVVASAIDENGEEKLPRKWNSDYLDLPSVKQQRQPSSTCAGISDTLLFACGQYRVLYALLAGCGPLRAGEALGLEIDKHISEDFRTLTIVQKAKRGEIQPYLKTKNGTRQVELCSQLAELLHEYVGERRSGLLFHSSTGAQLLQSNALSDSLHPILDYLAHERGGFNIFRRFRLSHLEKSDCPETLKHFWSGHAPRHVSERYVKLAHDRDFRLILGGKNRSWIRVARKHEIWATWATPAVPKSGASC